MNVAAIAADIVREATKPPRRKHQDYRRCIYCEIVVDEAVFIKGEAEWESFEETDEGLVCDVCGDDPLVVWRKRRVEARAARKATYSAQVRGSGRTKTQAERDARNARMIKMQESGMTHAQIGALVGMSPGGVGNAIYMERARAAIHGQT